MAETKYTPGEWVAEMRTRLGNGYTYIEVGEDERVEWIAQVQFMRKREDESIANAQLIAAAPDLLRELEYTNNLLKAVMAIAFTKEVQPYLPGDTEDQLKEFCKGMRVERAIAKAKGDV